MAKNTDGWVTVTQAAKLHDVKASQIHDARMEGSIPRWMAKNGSSWYVQVDSKGLKLHLQKKITKSLAAKKGHKRAKRREKMDHAKDRTLSYIENQRLEELSVQATLAKPITDHRLQKYKIEAQKLELEKKAGNMVSRDLASFLYMGYLERLNRELLTYQNRLETEFDLYIQNLSFRIQENEDIVSADEAKFLKKLIVRATEDVIRSVKKDQKKTIEDWAEDEGVQL